MNSKAKGSGYEREVQKYLESQGWDVFRVHRKPLFINKRLITVGADIFGCDIVGKKLGYKPKYIQVGVDGHRARKETQMREHPINPETEDAEIWLRIKGKRAFRVFRAILQEPDPLMGRTIAFTEQDIQEVKTA